MKIIFAGVILLCIGVACADLAFPQRSLAARAAAASVGGNKPYWFIRSPRKEGNFIQALQVPLSAGEIADDDEDDDNNYAQQLFVQDDDDDDDDDNDSSNDDQINEYENDDDDDGAQLNGNIVGIISLNEGNAIFSNPKNDADEEDSTGLQQLENDDEAEYDEDSTEETSAAAAIYIPRKALENIPEGNIVAIVDESEGRAVKKYYRRVRRGGKPKRRRRGGNRGRRRRRRGGNRNRRRRRPGVRRVNRRGGGNRRRRGNNQRRRQNIIRL